MNKLDILKDMLRKKYSIEGDIAAQHTRGQVGSTLYVSSKNVPECSVDIGTLEVDFTTINEHTANIAKDTLELFEDLAKKVTGKLYELSLTFANKEQTSFCLFLHCETMHTKVVFTDLINYKSHLNLLTQE